MCTHVFRDRIEQSECRDVVEVTINVAAELIAGKTKEHQKWLYENARLALMRPLWAIFNSSTIDLLVASHFLSSPSSSTPISQRDGAVLKIRTLRKWSSTSRLICWRECRPFEEPAVRPGHSFQQDTRLAAHDVPKLIRRRQRERKTICRSC